MSRKKYAFLLAGLAGVLLAGQASAAVPPGSSGGSERFAKAHLPAVRAAQGPSWLSPVSPVRVLDTRNGTGTGTTSPVGPGSAITINLSSVLPDAATSVILNLTATDPTGFTFVTVFPGGTARPQASNQNLVPGQTRANAVTVELGADQTVSFYNNAGSTHLIADLTGFYASDTGAFFTPQQPTRVLDTRGSGPVAGGGSVTIDLTGVVPASAVAVTFNLTGIGGAANTFVTAFPASVPRPLASSLNLAPGEVSPNQVTIALGSDKRVSLYNNAGNTHLIVDVAGFYAPDQGFSFFPTAPTRLFDTRDGGFGGLEGGDILGLCDFDPSIQAIVLNVTGTNTTGNTFLTVWPSDQDRPLASSLNLVPGLTAPNLVTVQLGTIADPQCTNKSFLTYNNAGHVDVVYDAFGLFAAPTPTPTP